MKKIYYFVLTLLLALSCRGERPLPSTPEAPDLRPTPLQIADNPDLADGLIYVYDFKAEPPMTPAPKGYKPFYISGFNRHGARFAMKEQYEMVKNALEAGAKAGVLTPLGEQFHKAYGLFYDYAILRQGELSHLGIEEMRTIGERVYRRFPEVFEGPTKASALATPVGRVIVSMASFIDALQALDPDLDAYEYSSESNSVILRPNWSELNVKSRKSVDELTAPYEPYFRQTVDVEGILGRLFTNSSKALASEKKVVFIRALYDISNGIRCIGWEGNTFEGIFTPDDRLPVIRGAWYRLMLFLGRVEGSGSLYPDFTAYTLKDIIDKADEDIASGEVQLRLRFSHDSSIFPLAVYMNIDGKGRTARNPEEAMEIFRPWDMPMGGGLQMIFFRKGDDPKILVKVLWNEREAQIDLPGGPYYDWEQFKEVYGARIEGTLEMINSLRYAND